MWLMLKMLLELTTVLFFYNSAIKIWHLDSESYHIVFIIYEKVSGVKSRTLFSLLRITKIPTLEVDIEVNFEEGQNIYIFRESCFFASIVCLLIFLHYSYNVNLLWTRYYTDQSTLYFAVVSNILRSLAHQKSNYAISGCIFH